MWVVLVVPKAVAGNYCATLLILPINYHGRVVNTVHVEKAL